MAEDTTPIRKSLTASRDVGEETIRRFTEELKEFYRALKEMDVGSRELQSVLDRIIDFWELMELEWTNLIVRREDLELEILEQIEMSHHIAELKVVKKMKDYIDLTNQLDLTEMKRTKKFMEFTYDMIRVSTDDEEQLEKVDEKMVKIKKEKREMGEEQEREKKQKGGTERERFVAQVSDLIEQYLEAKQKVFSEQTRVKMAMLKRELRELPHKEYVQNTFKKYTGDDLETTK